MDIQQKDKLIDELMVYLNTILEENGRTINLMFFDLSEESDVMKYFLKTQNMIFGDIIPVLNTCLSWKLIEYKVSGGKYRGLQLSERGQARAISVQRAKRIPEEPKAGISIGTLNANGNTQIGNHNTQNIEVVFREIVEKIDSADAPEEQKQEAKNRLQKFLEHPLVGTALGIGVQALLASLGFGG